MDNVRIPGKRVKTFADPRRVAALSAPFRLLSGGDVVIRVRHLGGTARSCQGELRDDRRRVLVSEVEDLAGGDDQGTVWTTIREGR